VNSLAVLVAAISTMALGGIWYSGLFMRAWAQESGVKAPVAAPPTYAIMFVLALLAAWAFATLLGPTATMGSGLTLGLKVGAFFVATSLWVNYTFAKPQYDLVAHRCGLPPRAVRAVRSHSGGLALGPPLTLHGTRDVMRHATLLQPRPEVATAMRQLADKWEFSLAGQFGWDLDEITAYREDVRTLFHADCRYSFRAFAEAIYPIDFSLETARALTVEALPDQMPDWIAWAPAREPNTWTGRWTLFILGENCD
jgi:hypothetical protein